MNGIGILLKKNAYGKYNLYIIQTDDDEIVGSETFDEERSKPAVFRQAQLALVKISQGLSREGVYDLREDVSI